MNSKITVPRSRSFSFYRLPQPRADFVAEILAGLNKSQKTIDPKFFYDFHGSQLYEKITRTFDYYVTRAENEILRRYASAITNIVGTDAVIIEPGSGSCKKVEYLIEALHPSLYVPIDISVGMLETACSRLASRYDWLSCFGIAGDINQFGPIANLLPSEQRRVVFFPGSTIGNFEPERAGQLLQNLRKLVQLRGGLLIGVDNIKEPEILERAYNDGGGITAVFNKNVLIHINRIAHAEFSPATFEHRAYFNREHSRIEMHLVSRCDQIVKVAGEAISFKQGETIHTENSYKYSRAAFRALAAEAGLHCVKTWHDQHDYFTLYYFSCDPNTVINEYSAK
jgi:L-histidine Nalpha-methyltransferase